jgi:hypothetical protein
MSKARDLASGAPAPAGVTSTEIGYVDGVTSAIQTQLNAKQAVVSGVNDTEIGYLDGVTSAIQTQINAQIPKSTVTAKGDLIVGTGAGTFVAQSVGSNGQLLSANSAQADGVEWVNPPTSGGWTQISSVSLSGQTAVNFSSFSGYKFLRVVANAVQCPSNIAFRFRVNNDSTTNRHRQAGYFASGTAPTWVADWQDSGLFVFPGSFTEIFGSIGNTSIIDIYTPNVSGNIFMTVKGFISTTQFNYNNMYTTGPATSLNFFSTGAAFSAGTLTLYGAN